MLQLEFLKLLHSQESTIFAVADEDQMVYEWRDARLATIREYEQHFDTRVEYLVQNYRSPQNIVDVANELIRHNQNRHDKELVSAVTGRLARLAVFQAETPAEEAAWIAELIESRLSEGQVPASQIAVLARFTPPIYSVLKALTEKGCMRPTWGIGQYRGVSGSGSLNASSGFPRDRPTPNRELLKSSAF